MIIKLKKIRSILIMFAIFVIVLVGSIYAQDEEKDSN